MQDQIEIAAAASAASAASKGTYVGAVVSFGGWFLSSEFGVLMGAVGVIGSLILTWYWKQKEFALKQRNDDREHELRLLEHEATMALRTTRTRKEKP